MQRRNHFWQAPRWMSVFPDRNYCTFTRTRPCSETNGEKTWITLQSTIIIIMWCNKTLWWTLLKIFKYLSYLKNGLIEQSHWVCVNRLISLCKTVIPACDDLLLVTFVISEIPTGIASLMREKNYVGMLNVLETSVARSCHAGNTNIL